MPKRFIDTNLLIKSWYRKLTPRMKAVWIHLCLSCDHAGIWDTDFELMSFQVGDEITEDDVLNAFSGRIERLESGKYLIESFVEFQYGELNDNNRVHKSVLDRLKKECKSKGLTRALQGCKDKDKDKEKDKEKEKDPQTDRLEPNPTSQLFELWNANCSPLPRAIALNEKRKKLARARWKENPSEEYWVAVIKTMARSKFHTGGNDRGWVANFDYFLKPGTHLSIVEKAMNK